MDGMDKNKTFLIVGLGLLGGKYAQVLSQKGYRVTGITHSQSTLDYALEHAYICEGRNENFDDLVQNAVEPVQQMLPEGVEFIASHPMAGRETSGVAHSAEVNFAPANFIITPTEKNTPEAIEWCRTLARTLGFARISVLSPAEHDHMIGYVSQLCHAIAVSLMCASDNTELAKYTGDSFRDLTRIARINDKMWAELFLWNKDNLISEIDMFSDALATMRQKLVDDDREGLEKMFRLSTERRKAFDKK